MQGASLLHTTGNYFPVKKQCNWSILDRKNRYIYFLSTGEHSCSDIEHLLKISHEEMKRKIAYLFIMNTIDLYQDGKNIINAFVLEQSFDRLQQYKPLAAKLFADALKGTSRYSDEMIFSFIHFMIIAVERNIENQIDVLNDIIIAYHLKHYTLNQYDYAIDVFLSILRYCLQDMWSNDLERYWRYVCCIFKYSILEMCQQK